MASTSTSSAGLRVFAIPEMMDRILSYVPSFADLCSVMRVCRPWHDMIKGNTVLRARYFLIPHLTNKDGAFMVLWQTEKGSPSRESLKTDTFSASDGEVTSEWNGKTTPQLHPSITQSQKHLKYPAFDGYPGFSVYLFDSKIQDPRFIDDMRKGARRTMQISHPPTLALYSFEDEGTDYALYSYVAYPDPIDLEVYEGVLKDHPENLEEDQEMQGALIIPHDDKYVARMNEREGARIDKLQADAEENFSGDEEDEDVEEEDANDSNDNDDENEEDGDGPDPDLHEVTKLLVHLGLMESE